MANWYDNFLSEENKTKSVSYIVPSKTKQEEPIDGGFFEDLYIALQQGFDRGFSVNEAFDVYKQGANISDEDLEAYINAVASMDNSKITNEQYRYQKAVKENGGGFFGAMKALYENPGYAPQFIVTSGATMLGSLIDSEEVAGYTAAGSGVGAAAGSAVPLYGTVGGAVAGAFTGLIGSMETSLTLTELLRDELGNQKFTKENIRDILENPEAIERIKNRSLARGMTIAMVEGLTLGLSRGVGSAVFKSVTRKGTVRGAIGTALAVGGATGTVEMLGGGTGEFLGQVAAGQEIKGEDIFLEAIGEAKGIVNVSDIISNASKPTSYQINNKFASKKDVESILNDKNLTPEELLKIDIKVENDANLQSQITNTRARANIKKNIDKNITDDTDIDNLIDLEIERRSLQENKKDKKGAFKPLNLDKKIEDNQKKIDDILSKYEGVTAEDVKDVVGKAFILENYAVDVAFAEKYSDIYDLKFNELKDNAAVEKYIKDNNLPEPEAKALRESSGIVNDVTGELLINKTKALEVRNVNVGNHELLHAILRKAVRQGKISKKLISDLKTKIGSKNWSKVEQRIEDSGYNDPNLTGIVTKEQAELYGLKVDDSEFNENNEAEVSYMEANPDEYITQLSEAILEGDVKLDRNMLQKLADYFTPILRFMGFKNINFENADATLEFLREYHKSIKTGKLSKAIIKATASKRAGETGVKMSRSKAVDAVNEIEQGLIKKLNEQGKEYTQDEFRTSEQFGELVDSITESGGAVNNYIKSLGMSKEKTKETIEKVSRRLMNYNPQAERKTGSKEAVTIGERIMSDTQFAKLDAARDLAIEAKREGKTKRIDAAKRTKEGETTFDIEDTGIDAAMETLETEDISPQAEARRKREAAKKEEPTKSQLRQEIGIEDGSDAYNTILETARKVLIRAYDAGKTARQIQRDLTKEASTYLFKQVKNMLGTKAKYIPTIKKLRVALINSMFTSDLVQMERNVADDQRVFTKFVGKLTSKQEVQNAVDNNLLPPSALNTIDKGQSVNLYEKVMPTEEQFVAFFDQPLVNPKTGVRSGLRGTRKDQLAKYVAASLNFDATMQVAQETEVAEKRQQIAELRGETIDDTDIQVLSATINRKPNLKFSRASNRPVVSQNLAFHLEELFSKDITKNKKLTQKDVEKYVENLTYKIPGQGVTIGEAMSNKDKKAFTNYALGTIRAQEYAKIVDKDLRNELIKNFEKAVKEGKVVNEGILNEQKGTKVLNENTQNSKVVKGSGDTYIQLFNTIFGFEHKLGDAQWVSRTFNFVKGKFVPTTENTTENFNEDISKLIKEKVFSEIITFLESNDIDTKNFNPNNLTSEQAEAIKAFKDGFQVTTEVSLQYVINDYINNKYSGDNAQSFLVIEGNVYLMPTESTSYENAKIVAKHFNSLSDAKIKPLQLVDGVDNITVHISAQVKDTGVLNFRMRPKLISKNFKSSEVNIYKDKNAAKKLGEAMNLAAKEIQNTKLSKSVRNVRSVGKYSKTSRGMSAFDFDETVGISNNFVIATKDNQTVRISSEQWPVMGEQMVAEGWKMDFSDFNKVTGGKPGPLMQKLKNRIKQFGPKNTYILTARAPESASAIHAYLKSEGVNIPLENITGLGNSTAEAKAMWIANKYSEGYNDIYFVDDALPNVKAVADVINQLDIKGKSVQAKMKFSKSLNREFNDIIEDVKGIDSKKRFSEAKGRARGQGKGRFRFFVPPSHEDFVGLLYNFIGFGRKGNKHRDFFEKALIKPLNRAFRELNVAKQAIANDYRNLVKSMPQVRKRLGEKILKGDYTVEDAIRVYLFDKAGFEIPGLTKTDLKNLVEFVKSQPMIQGFADQVGKISRVEEGYISPGDSWQASNIRYDLVDATGRIGRAKFFTEFQENVDIIFSDENMNKIRAAFGDNFVEALQDMLYRIKTGSNRPAGNNRIVNKFLDWINGSVGATMFFNARSAVLQTLSTVNFINFGDNNIFKAAAAFANQKQFWSDFAALFNSDFLKQRRSGAAFDVNANEIAREVAGSKNPVLAAIKYLLNIGFLPTQLADSFAIASGGATFYRNRIKTYLKQGLSQKEAESKAFIDFQEIAEATQQSARPDMVSQQQTSTLGRIILAFQNVTAQYARLIKKAGLDLVNRRRSRGYQTQVQSDMSNISRIIYYGAIQAVIFNALQNALFAMMFDEEEEDEEKTKKFFDTKKQRVINGTIDSLLKGLGVGGAIVSTLKNYAIKLTDNLESKSFFKTPAWEELLQLSPPIGIKIRKIARAEKNLEWNKDVLTELPLDNLDNPIYETSATYIEGFTNVPTARLLRKVQNLNAALDSENKWWQRIAVAAGWSRWDVGIQDNEIKEIKNAIRENNKRINEETKLKQATPEEKIKIVEKSVFDLSKNEQIKILDANNLNPKNYPREADRVEAIMNLRNKNERKIDSTINAIENYIPTEKEQRSIDLFKMNKKDQVNMLIDFGLTPKQIRDLKYEEDRVNKIIQLENKSKSKK